ncbi:MAG: hypothetical protein SGBAC_013093 [Bacillariaceae sp.]
MSAKSRPRRYQLSVVKLVLVVGLSSLLVSYRHDLSIFVEPRSSTSTTSATVLGATNIGIQGSDNLRREASAESEGSDAAERQIIIVTETKAPVQLTINIADSRNRLIVLIASCPYLDLVDNLVQSLLVLQLHNYVVVPLDEASRSYAMELFGDEHVVGVPPFAPSLSGKQAKFNSPAFAKITSVRPQVLHAFLEQGFTIFYNDVDVVWRKNIFEVFDPSDEGGDKKNVDMVAMVDSHPVEEAFICSCYLYLKPTSPMKKFLLHWQSLLDNTTTKKPKKKKYKNDQEAIYDAYQDITKTKDGTKSSLQTTLYASDNEYFPSGAVYDVWPSEKQSNAYLVHNNFIRGHNFKINRFLKWKLWNPSSKMEEMDLECNAKA